MKREKSGQITVFLSLILIFVCALICGLLESARTAGAGCYLQTAAYSAMDSLFSQYHRALWEEYRIFGLEHLEEEQLSEEYRQFLEPYLKQKNWYPFRTENCQVQERKVLTDDSGKYFEQEILDYMKYGIWTKEWSEESATEVQKELTEARQVSELTRSMDMQTKDAWKLEKALEDLGKCLNEQKCSRDTAAGLLQMEDGSGFCRESGQLIRKLKQIPSLVEKYEKQADMLDGQLQKLRESYAEKVSDLSSSVQSLFEAELLEYEAYTSRDGERRRQIAGLPEEAEKRIALVEAVSREAEEVEEYIADWEPEDEEDELDTAALWRPVQAHFAEYDPLSLPFQAGIADKEKEGLLKKLREMADRGILSLVLPEGTRVSAGLLDTEEFPSRQIDFEERDSGMLKKAMAAEYSQIFFHHFCDTGDEEPAYELEYLLIGEDIDETNLVKTVHQLLAVREGLNLIHILGDSEKRAQARALASSIIGASGLLPLVAITAFLIMGVWAFGEAAADVRCLLEKEKVPLLKGKEDWKLSLDQLLDFAAKGSLGDLTHTENGLDYPQYLTLLLMVGAGTRMLYRMMDMIQMNLEREQNGFRMADCAYRVDIRTEVCGKHVYFALGLLKSMGTDRQVTYPAAVQVSRQY